MANGEAKKGHVGEGTTRMSYERLLQAGNATDIEFALRELVVGPLSHGNADAFIAGAVSPRGKEVRRALITGESISQSPIRQDLIMATNGLRLVQKIEEETIPALSSHAQQSLVEKTRRDNEANIALSELQVLWESPYLDKNYVQGLQDEVDRYFFLPDEAEKRKNHVSPRIVTALEAFMESVPFSGDALLLLEDDRRRIVGAPAQDGLPTTYGSLAELFGPITTPGKFQGRLMHSGQLEAAFISFANTIYAFIQNQDNFPKGKTERDLWESIRKYAGAEDQETDELALLRFQDKIKTAFNTQPKHIAQLESALLYLPFNGKTFSPLLNRLARDCAARGKKIAGERKTKTAITVDTREAGLLEDAFWVERLDDGGFRVEISVADVAALLNGNYELILEAIRRRETHYTSEGRIPIFPQGLQEALNLIAGDTYPAVTFTIDFHDGNLSPSLNMTQTAVYIQSNLTYEMADLLYMGNRDVAPMLQNADILAQKLAEQRQRRRDRIQAIDGKDPAKISERVVAEFMTLLNTLVAKYMSREPRMPALYLDHSTTINGHNYSHYITTPESGHRRDLVRVPSPARRIADTINHIQLLAKVFKKGEHFSEQQLSEICDYLNESYDALMQ